MNKVPNLRFKEFSDSWYCRKLNDILIDTRLGGNYKNTESITPFPLIKMGNLSRGHINLNKIEYITHDEVLNSDDILQKGDLLFNTRNTLDLVGKVAIWNNELELAYYNSNIMKLIFDSGQVSNNYFMNYLFNTKSSLSRLKSFATGTTSVAAIYTKDLKQMKIEIPSCREQEKIAAFFSLIDKKIELQTEKVEELKNYKKGLLQKIFPRKGELVPELRFVGFTNDWEECKLEKVTKLITKGTTPKDKSWIGPVNYIKTESIDKDSGSLTRTASTSLEEHEGYLKRSQLQNNDVLFSIVGTLGRVGLVGLKDLPANTNQQIAIIRTDELNPYFLMNILKSPKVKSFIESDSTVGAQPSLSLWQINELKICVPSIAEQQKIGHYFFNLDKLITLHQCKLDALNEYKKGLLQQMFI